MDEQDRLEALEGWAKKAYFLLSNIHDSGSLFIFESSSHGELTPYGVAMEYSLKFKEESGDGL